MYDIVNWICESSKLHPVNFLLWFNLHDRIHYAADLIYNKSLFQQSTGFICDKGSGGSRVKMISLVLTVLNVGDGGSGTFYITEKAFFIAQM